MSKNMKFEDAMARLDEITRMLESGTLSLDESISAYEEAVKLIKLCNDKLDTAEEKVRILTAAPDGTITDKDFTVEDEA